MNLGQRRQEQGTLQLGGVGWVVGLGAGSHSDEKVLFFQISFIWIPC